MIKMREEMDELEHELDDDGGSPSERARDEMGDVLFVMANLARHLGVEPETALQRTNTTFKRRFESMESPGPGPRRGSPGTQPRATGRTLGRGQDDSRETPRASLDRGNTSTTRARSPSHRRKSRRREDAKRITKTSWSECRCERRSRKWNIGPSVSWNPHDREGESSETNQSPTVSHHLTGCWKQCPYETVQIRVLRVPFVAMVR